MVGGAARQGPRSDHLLLPICWALIFLYVCFRKIGASPEPSKTRRDSTPWAGNDPWPSRTKAGSIKPLHKINDIEPRVEKSSIAYVKGPTLKVHIVGPLGSWGNSWHGSSATRLGENGLRNVRKHYRVPPLAGHLSRPLATRSTNVPTAIAR